MVDIVTGILGELASFAEFRFITPKVGVQPLGLVMQQ